MRFLYLLTTVALATCCNLQAKTPNVLFILCDDLRPDALGCYGSRHVKTPHIDQLATEGVRYAHTFCTTSLCSPSRASILTGLYAHAHTVTNNFTELPAQLTHFPARLQEQGYSTAYIGKWHMGEENDEPRPGFDYFVTHKGQGSYFDTTFNLNGKERKMVKGYYTTVVTDMALDWMKQQRTKDKPWCLMLGHKAPHSFYTPEQKYSHSFDDVKVPYPASAFHLEDKPAWMKHRINTWHGIYGPLFEWRKKFPDSSPEAVKDFENMVHGYWGTILSVDDSVARLRGWLSESGLLEDTVIVFMGDNGLLEGEHGMVDKRTAHEPSMRIPLIIRATALGRQKVVQQQVLTVDLAPTLLELCSAPALSGIHGKSLVKLTQDGDPEWRKAVVYYYNFEKQFPYTPNVRALRTDRWKYIRYPEGDASEDSQLAELYDLEKDPGEIINLASSPSHSEQVSALREQLAAELKSLGLTPETDTMPVKPVLGTELPDQKIR
jgi:arylsulfatase A-like enzyme